MAIYNVIKSVVKFRIGGSCFNDSAPEKRQTPLTLVFSGIYLSCGNKNVLANICGRAEPGELLAIMGPSGCGKTTLLNALSGRKRIDKGAITLNGQMLNKSLKRHIALVEQQELFIATLTLDYTLQFHAQMRLPSNMTYQQKMDYKTCIAQHFKLDDPGLLKTIIGDVSKRGLSGGELKRVNIACEMFRMPSVLLVDEPTTGLDSHNALNVIQILKDYAIRNRTTVVVTVHQPSSLMFQKFDKLLVMGEGKVAYFGSRADVIDAFTKLDMKIEPHYNPGDFIIDQLHDPEKLEKLIAAQEIRCTANCSNTLTDYTAKKAVKSPYENQYPSIRCSFCEIQGMYARRQQPEERPNGVTLKAVVNGSNNGTSNVVDTNGHAPESADDSIHSSLIANFNHSSSTNQGDTERWPISFFQQVLYLTKRNFMASRRRYFTFLDFFQTLVLSIVVAILWFWTPRREESLDRIKGFTFFSAKIWLLQSVFVTMTAFPEERAVINRERASGMYRLSAYYCAKMISDIPIMLVYPTIYHFISYMFFGEQSFIPGVSCLYNWVILMLSVIGSQALGSFIPAICHNMKRAVVACSLYCLPSILFGGFFVQSIPSWLSWVRYTSPVHYCFHAMQIIEIVYGEPIKCAEKNSAFDVCRNGNATFIPYGDILELYIGDDPHVSLGIDILVLFGYFILFRLLAYLALKYYKSPTRTI